MSRRDRDELSPRLVIKFGGTSLGTPGRIRRAARRVAALVDQGVEVVAVVSAVGRTTDRILKLAGQLGPWPAGTRGREVDRALATGEDLSAALLAASLNNLGRPARSLRGGEAGLVGEGPHGNAVPARFDPARVLGLFERGLVPVVSGFQAVNADGETVTLGRGGSDTTAVALSIGLGKARSTRPTPVDLRPPRDLPDQPNEVACEIVTDVPAVYDRDPRRDRAAKPLDRITHDELLALAESGGKVIHAVAARLAKLFHVPLRVYGYDSAITDRRGGTLVGVGEDRSARVPSERAGLSPRGWQVGADDAVLAGLGIQRSSP